MMGIPNCVPEYYRSLQEDADHRWELAERRREHYRANQDKIEAASGGADRCTELLLAAGYRPDGAGVVENMRGHYEAGEKDEAGNYIRIPQETWRKKEEIKK